MTKRENEIVLDIEYCNLEIICYLVLVIWDLRDLILGKEEVDIKRVL